MKISTLITTITASIRDSWYRGLPREYKRDERALMKCIARYGYECERRGWNFNATDIQADLLTLLNQIKHSGAVIGYLPVYLEGAVDRRIRLRAEQLSASAKSIQASTTRVLSGVQPIKDLREQTDVEVLSALYRDLKSRRKKRPLILPPNERFLL